MTIVYGNTYPHRATIKALGFRWDPNNKEWYTTNPVSKENLEALQSMRGVIVEAPGIEQVDNRSHKEKFGRCEDAPCCGCCGPNAWGGSW